MRIFFAVPRAAWVQVNLKQSLEAMGHELVSFTFAGWPDDADPAWRERGKPATNERLLAAFRTANARKPIDLLFGYFYSSVVYPETIDALRASGVPTVNFSCNNVHQFHLVESIAPRFDYCIVPEKAALASFVRVGARPLRIQLAANPAVYRAYPVPREYDATFVGQRYADRAELLNHLHDNGICVRAWGAGWQTRKRLDWATAKAAAALLEDEQFDGIARMIRAQFAVRRGRADATAPGVAQEAVPNPPGDPVSYGGPRLLQRDLIGMYSRSRISLGFATAGDSHRQATRLTHLRLREFEAPMSGALYLTERQDELEEYFVVGQEVLAYRDREEMLELCRYYLGRPEQAETIRRAGHHRALREHTWQHRFRELFQLLGLRDR